MGRNTTGPPCSRGAVIRLEATWRHRLACAGEAACMPAVECYRRRQTPATVTSLAHTVFCVGGPLITNIIDGCCGWSKR